MKWSEGSRASPRQGRERRLELLLSKKMEPRKGVVSLNRSGQRGGGARHEAVHSGGGAAA
jgi:hypothetical protein